MLERSVKTVHQTAFWLYYMGNTMLVVAVLGLGFKGYELFTVFGMTELSKTAKVSNEDLNKQFDQIVTQYSQEMESFTTSKTDRHLLRQKVRQRISVIPENWHFNWHFVLKTTKTPVFPFVTEIL